MTQVLGGTDITDTGLNTLYPGGLDTTTFTITQNSIQQGSKIYTIPANDPVPGTVYRLYVWGQGTQGGTAQGLNVGFNVLGTTNFFFITSTSTIPTGQQFWWAVENQMMFTTVGAACSAQLTMRFTWSQKVATASGNNNSVAFSGSFTAVNSTIAITAQQALWWASTTGAPTVTSNGSIFERLYF